MASLLASPFGLPFGRPFGLPFGLPFVASLCGRPALNPKPYTKTSLHPPRPRAQGTNVFDLVVVLVSIVTDCFAVNTGVNALRALRIVRLTRLFYTTVAFNVLFDVFLRSLPRRPPIPYNSHPHPHSTHSHPVQNTLSHPIQFTPPSRTAHTPTPCKTLSPIPYNSHPRPAQYTLYSVLYSVLHCPLSHPVQRHTLPSRTIQAPISHDARSAASARGRMQPREALHGGSGLGFLGFGFRV